MEPVEKSKGSNGVLSNNAQYLIPTGIRSQDANEMMTKTPPALLRWGNFIIIFIVLFFFIIASVVKYGDTEIYPAYISMSPPVVRLKAAIDGKIANLFFNDGQQIKEGDVIACMAADDDYTSIIYLDSAVVSILHSIDRKDFQSLDTLSTALQLISLTPGEIQFYLNHLLQDIALLKSSATNRQSYNVASITRDISFIRNYIKKWKSQYLFIAPCNGKLVFFQQLSKDMIVSVSHELFGILPSRFSYVARFDFPSSAIGKVTVGQKVNIRVDNYPSNEYGYLTAIVNKVNDIPQSYIGYNNQPVSIYHAYAAFPDSLITSTGKKLPFLSEISGKVEITAVSQSLLKKMTSRLLNH